MAASPLPSDSTVRDIRKTGLHSQWQLPSDASLLLALWAMLRYIFIILAATVHSAALAHPVSHTDAWVTVSDAIDIRLKVFLDDVVRHQLQTTETKLSADQVEEAIRQHAGTLLQQLCIFQRGIPLAGRVTSLPRWHPKKSEVDLESDASLKLTWNLRFDLADPAVRTLCFVHQFSHVSLTKPGELRLNLRRAGAERRISAAIPPARPFTVVLPADGSAAQSSVVGVNVNVAVSRLVIAPAAVVHEFTAPLLLVDHAWPPVRQLREAFVGGEGAAVAAFLEHADVQDAEKELADWFQSSVSLSSNGEDLVAVGVDVEFFPDGVDSDAFDPDASDGFGLPLYGTTVGVRVRYPPQRSAQSLKVAFDKNPGILDVMTVEKIDGVGQTSELVDFAAGATDQGLQPVLKYSWVPSALFMSSQPSGLQEPAGELLSRELISSEKVRPGRFGVSVGLVLFTIILAMLIKRRGTMRLIRWIGVLCLSAVAALLTTWLLPDSKIQIDTAGANSVVEGLLTGVYHATVQSKSGIVVERLGKYLQVDLVEEVYLSTVEAMMSSETGEVFIDLESVSIDEFRVEGPHLKGRLQTRCTWRVRGTVHHWGHAHVRELVSVGEIGLVRDGGRWKIRTVSLTETSGISAPDENPENS